MVSPTLPQDLTAGLEREFVASSISDISDLSSVDHTPALLEHQQWIPDGGSGLGGRGVGGHPQISSGYNSNISRRRTSCTRLFLY